MNIQIYADGANLASMVQDYKEGKAVGFTTNPSLMKKAGITDYKKFCQEVVAAIPDVSVSFEVFSDDFDTMEKEAKILAAFGPHVFVKIPIMNTQQESAVPLIKTLSEQGVNINVTAVFTVEQVEAAVAAVSPKSQTIISIFAGRLADRGIDPLPVMQAAEKICHAKPNVSLLWASTREAYNIVQADAVGCDMITVPSAIISKAKKNFGKSAMQGSLETVETFAKDIQDLGFSIL